jgi:predicted nucleic acid-binding protein
LVSVFIDTSVLIYAAGGEHRFREPCKAIVDRISVGEIDAVTSVEVVQEILHRYRSIRQVEGGAILATKTMDLFAPVLPITHALMRRVPALAGRYPDLAARDIVHVATCIHEGIDEIVSTDRGFDAVREIRRIDPMELGA